MRQPTREANLDKRAFGQHRQHRVHGKDTTETRQDTPAHAKKIWRAGTMLSPVPPVLLSCGGTAEYPANIVTVAWTGTVCSEPPMLSFSLRPTRHSHGIIEATRECVVNLATASLSRVVDWCGVKSGRDFDKFKEMHLTALPSSTIRAPMIGECPVNIECKVRKVLHLGSHDMFLAEITAVQVSKDLLDARGKLRLDKAELLAFAHGEYYALGRRLGYFGFSVRK